MGGFRLSWSWPFREFGHSSLCACGSYSRRLHTDHCYTNCSLNYKPSSQRLISRRSVGGSYHGIGGCNDVTKHAIEMHYHRSSRQFVRLISVAHNEGKQTSYQSIVAYRVQCFVGGSALYHLGWTITASAVHIFVEGRANPKPATLALA